MQAQEAARRSFGAVAEEDLVAVGQGEHLGEPVAELADREADGGLPVARAHVGPGDRVERVHGLGADLRGSTAEATVTGQQIGGDGNGRQRLGHRCNYRGRALLRRIGSLQ